MGLMVTVMAKTELAQLKGHAADAVADCAQQAHILNFRPLSNSPGIEIYNDNPTVRQLYKPVVNHFKSRFSPVRWRFTVLKRREILTNYIYLGVD